MKKIMQSPSRHNNLIGFLIGSLVLVLVFLSELLQAQELIIKSNMDQSKDKILIVTNRFIEDKGQGQIVVEPRLTNESSHHFLTAQLNGETWVYSKESSLISMLNQSVTYDDWVVFIHGDGKTLKTSVDRAREIQKLHKVNVLVYSWPSKDSEMNGIRNFKNSYSNVELSSPMLYNFLTDLSELKTSNENPFQNHQMSLFLHSLGNYYLERLAVEGLLDDLKEPIFDNLMINAAAVEQEGHHNWVEQISFAERIYINSNDDDMSLSGLRILTKLGRQLGESPEPPYAQNAYYINFTKAVGFPGSMGPSHSYYFATITDKSENIKNYYTTLLHGKKAPLYDSQLFTYASDEVSYSIIF